MTATPPGPGSPPPPYGWAPPPPPPPPPPRPNRPPWRLVRREEGRLLGGVTTGVADAFGIDVTVIRVLWVIATIATGGLGLAAYALCWIAFPSDEHPAPMTQVRYRSPGYVVGLALIGIGLLITFGQLVALAPYHGHFSTLAWATVLIGGGLAILWLRHPDDDDDDRIPNVPPGWDTRAQDIDTDAASTASPTPPADHAPSDPSPTDHAPADAADADAAPADDDNDEHDDAAQDATAARTSTAWSQYTAWPTTPPWPHPPHRPRRPRPRSFLTPLTLSVLLIGAGVVWLLESNGNTDFTVAGVLAGGLCIVGLALVLSTWFGRARGLIPLGILLLLVSVPAASIDVPITSGTGNRQYFPTTRTEMRSKYELGIGRLELDLLAAPLVGHTSRIRVEVGIGEMVVNVPTTVRVVARAHAGAGSIDLFGNNDDGGWPDEETRAAPGTGPGLLELDLRVGAGHIEVRRFDPNGTQTILPGGSS